jgi:hypothetical protein
MTRLEPLKGQINISQVCQVALEAKVQTHEAIEQALTDEDVMRGLIQRLKIQKGEANDRSHAQGQEDGKNWAIREATYQELGSWGRPNVHHYRAPKNIYEADVSAAFDETGEIMFEISLPDSRAAIRYLDTRQKAAESEDQPFEFPSYQAAFLDAVREVWNQVKGELEE